MSIKLIHGDCLKEMLKFPDNYVDMVVTSPPYDNLRNYGKDFNTWTDIDWMLCLKLIYKKLKPGGVCVWVVSDATINGSETGTSFRQALYAIKCGFNLHDTMIWDKKNFRPLFKGHRYYLAFEYMFIFSKGQPKTFNPIRDKINKLYGIIPTGSVRQKDGSMKQVKETGKKIRRYGYRSNIWKMNSETTFSKIHHPAQFPEQLAHDHIVTWSNEGDIVLDPMMGSGTTGLPCIYTNRDFIGIELDEHNFKIAKLKLNA